MTGAEVQVDPADLHRKATQLDSLTWADAAGQPALAPPDALPGSSVAVANLGTNVSALWAHQQFGRVEGQRLAQTLRNVANAYAEVDRAAGHDIDATMGGPAGAPADSTVFPQRASIPAPAKPASMPIPKGQPPPDQMLFPPQVQHALDAGDDGTSLRAAAQMWRTNAQVLESSAQQFEVESILWEGEAADTAYRKFTAYRDWLVGLADNWKRLAGEADRIVAAHEQAQRDHRPIAEEYQRLHDQVMGKPLGPDTLPKMERMAALQRDSEALRNVYSRDSQPHQITPEDPPDPVVSGVPVTAEQHRQATRRLPQDAAARTAGGPAGAAPGREGRQGGAPVAPPTDSPAVMSEGGSPGAEPPTGQPGGGGAALRHDRR
ncbi:PPE domain-containing protein [Mycolicibacterium vaccae]|uniref:PPE domain-containing protein n=1 Tax=Mycolicibacterium vaccae TaxID=1810 RepID=UPI003CFFC187